MNRRGLLSLGLGGIVAWVAFWVGLVWFAQFLSSKANRPPVAAGEIRTVLDGDARTREVPFRNVVDEPPSLSASGATGSEPPLLAEAVRSGRLPPLHERIGGEPLVLRGPEGTGRHGGTWIRLAVSRQDVMAMMDWRMNTGAPLRFSAGGDRVEPLAFREIRPSADFRTWTATLRKGSRWSDGSLFTSRDVADGFKWQISYFRQKLDWLRTTEKGGVDVTAPAPLTVLFRFKDPHPRFAEELARKGAILTAFPSAYLLPFHPDRFHREWIPGDAARLEKEMKRRNCGTPENLFSQISSPWNPDLPRLSAWIPGPLRKDPPYEFVRNPYFCAVDEKGNQLPYVDRVLFEIRSPDSIARSVGWGEATMQERHLRFEDLGLLASQAEKGRYRILRWDSAVRSTWVLFPNLNRRAVDGGFDGTRGDPDEERIVGSNKGRLLNDLRFRRALSLSLPREEILGLLAPGESTPSQVEPGKGSRYSSPELANAFVRHDPVEANRLLDELGLVRRDDDGMRTFSDGRRMHFFIETTDFTSPEPEPMVIEALGRVGLRFTVRNMARSLFFLRKSELLPDFTVWMSESEFDPFVDPRCFVPTTTESLYAAGWARWYQMGGLHRDVPDAKGVFPTPPADHPLRVALSLWDEASREPSVDLRDRNMRSILALAATNLWTISLGTAPPQLVAVREDFRNVPGTALCGGGYSSPLNACPETFFFLSNQDPPSVRQAVLSHLTRPPRDGASETSDGTSPERTRGPLLFGFSIALLLLAFLLVLRRFPFLLPRLLFGVLTLFLCSVLVFSLARLSPGDYLSHRMAESELMENPVSSSFRKDLARMFHPGESVTTAYFRWTGLLWFTSFRNEDSGLLQFNLGRSMEGDGIPVAKVAGERLLLTSIVLSLALLLTVGIALPAGIYGAVKPSSIGDWFFSVFALLGMSVPGFLLGLILVSVSLHLFGVPVSGLFSPTYGGRSDWSWDRLFDLLGHLWIPVGVLAFGGIGNMVRVMRSELVDELPRPHVTARRARGVPPLLLLLDSPVRVALGPFFSSLGSLFPGFVSSSVLLAVVLNLPTVGPMLLAGMGARDTGVVAAMLMFLCALSVLGTFVCDALALILDPRRRRPVGRAG